MTPLALALVLTAAVLHAIWNLSAKRAGTGVPFIFAVGVVMTAYYVPLLAGMALFWPAQIDIDPTTIGVIAVSTVLKTGYALFLQRAYRSGDFSLVYPLVRGSAPLLAMLGAVLFLGERPTPLGIFGAICIVVSIFSSVTANDCGKARLPTVQGPLLTSGLSAVLSSPGASLPAIRCGTGMAWVTTT
jgi:drug/metabolite transporter (DMT)-like permease